MNTFNKTKSIVKILGYMKDGNNNDRIQVQWVDGNINWVNIENVNCPLLLSDFFLECENKILIDFSEQNKRKMLNESIKIRFNDFFEKIGVETTHEIEFSLQTDRKAGGEISSKFFNDIKMKNFDISGRVSHQFLENIIYDFQMKNMENLYLYPLDNFKIMPGFEFTFEKLFERGRYALVDNVKADYQFFLMKNTIFKKLYNWKNEYVVFQLSRKFDMLIEKFELTIPQATELTFKNIINDMGIEYRDELNGGAIVIGPEQNYLKKNFEKFSNYSFMRKSNYKKIFIHQKCLNYIRSTETFKNFLTTNLKIYQYYKNNNGFVFEEIYKEGGMFTLSKSILKTIVNSPYNRNFIQSVRESDLYEFVLPAAYNEQLVKIFNETIDEEVKDICLFLQGCITNVYYYNDLEDFIKRHEIIHFKNKRLFFAIHTENRNFNIKNINTVNKEYFM